MSASNFKSLLSFCEECINEDDLRSMFVKNVPLIAYDGFEPSGRIHIAQGIMRTINTNKLTKCGAKFKFWIADWYAMLNNKYGGDLKKIKNAGLLMIETFKACGMDLENVEFLWSSEEINKNPNKYWSLVMDISTKFNLNRILKCTQIMGRSESDDLNASQIFYPVMQCADIFYLDVNICSLGLDQRKVNMLAREYCDKINIDFSSSIFKPNQLKLNLNSKKGPISPYGLAKLKSYEMVARYVFPHFKQLNSQREESNEWVKSSQKNFKARIPSGLPRFLGGLVGYFGYETIKFIESKSS